MNVPTKQREYSKEWRNKPKNNFYGTRAWRVIRGIKLHQNPICEKCRNLATEVHHIKPIADYPHLMRDINNLQSLCKSCHSGFTLKEIFEAKTNKRHNTAQDIGEVAQGEGTNRNLNASEAGGAIFDFFSGKTLKDK